MTIRQGKAHAVIGPVSVLEERTVEIGGIPARVTVMRLEPRCPAPPKGRRGHPKHISVNIESTAARLQVTLAKPPRIEVKGGRLLLGELGLDFGRNWKSVEVAGQRYDLAKFGPRLSYEFSEEGRLAGILL